MEELGPEAIDRVLYREGFGMLATSAEGVPSVVPMSFGYDGETCFLQMTTSGRKNDAIAANPRVALQVLSVDYDAGISESVLVEGTIGRVDEADVPAAMESLAANAVFGADLTVWGVPVQEADLGLYRIDPERRSGRRFGSDVSF